MNFGAASRAIHSPVLVPPVNEIALISGFVTTAAPAFGPVPWTMFNDDVQKGYFDVYDQYLMNILYHPEVRPGMTVQEVKAVLPQVLADVRAFVARVNKLEP